MLRLRSEQEDLSASGGELSVSGASEERSVLVKQLHDAQHNLLMEKVKYAVNMIFNKFTHISIYRFQKQLKIY